MSGGTAGALSADDVGPAGALPAHGVAGGAGGPGIVAAAGQGPVVIERRQGAGGVSAELGGAWAIAQEDRDQNSRFHFRCTISLFFILFLMKLYVN